VKVADELSASLQSKSYDYFEGQRMSSLTHVSVEGKLQFSLNSFLDSFTETRVSSGSSTLISILD
jgi:hypothetical protein